MPADRLGIAEQLAAAVNGIRERWKGNCVEWWVGLEDTTEGQEMAARLAGRLAPVPPTTEELDRARRLIADHSWKFAKTMAKCPHWYTLRQTWSAYDDYAWFVGFIRRCGTPEHWGKLLHIYLCLDEWKYWTMGAPLRDTMLVNRARLDGTKDDRGPKQLSLL